MLVFCLVHGIAVVQVEAGSCFHVVIRSVALLLLQQRRETLMPKRKKHSRKKASKRNKHRSSDSSAQPQSSSDSGSASSGEKRDWRPLRRGIPIFQLPFTRLQSMLSAAEERFDHSWTSGMTTTLLAILLWVVTKIRPDSVSNRLGAKTYKEARKVCQAARHRVVTLEGVQRYEGIIGELLRAGQDDIQAVATKYGFDVAWLATGKKSKGSKRTKGSIEDLEHQLAEAKRRNQVGSGSPADSGSPDRALAPAQCNTHVQATASEPTASSSEPIASTVSRMPGVPAQALPAAVPSMDSSGRALAAFSVPLSSGTSQVGESEAPQAQTVAGVPPLHSRPHRRARRHRQ